MDPSCSWLIPKLSLITEAQMELDRRAAARMTREQLCALVDDLIISWYQHMSCLDQALGEVRQMQVKLALADAPKPGWPAPSAEHYRWAQELRG